MDSMVAPEADTVTGSVPSDGLWVSYFPSGRAYLESDASEPPVFIVHKYQRGHFLREVS